MNDDVNRIFERVKAAAIAAGDKASEVFDATSKKAGEIWSITRLSIEIADLQNDINEIYKELGKLVYLAHVRPGAQPAGVDEKLAEIDRKKAEISACQKKIDAMRATRRCPNERCGVSVDKNDAYCRQCGQELPFRQETESACADGEACDCEEKDCAEGESCCCAEDHSAGGGACACSEGEGCDCECCAETSGEGDA